MRQDDFNALPDDINQFKQLVLSTRAALDSKNKVVTEHSKALDDKQTEILRLNEIIKLFQGRVFGKAVRSHLFKRSCLTKPKLSRLMLMI